MGTQTLQEVLMGMFRSLFGGRREVPDAATLQAAGAKVIDVRSRREYQSGHVAGARNIDVGAPDFPRVVERLNRRHTYVVYCQSGNRSARAATQMQAAGFTVVDGGGIGRMQSTGWTLEG